MDSRNIDILQVFVKKDADQKWMIDYFILDGQEVLHLRKYTKHDGCHTTYDQQGQFLEKGKVNLKSNKYRKFLTRDMLVKSARVASMWIEQDADGNYYGCSESGCIPIPVDDGSGGDDGDDDNGDDDENDDDDDDNNDDDNDNCYDADGCACNDEPCKTANEVNRLFDAYATDEVLENSISSIDFNKRVVTHSWRCINSLAYSIKSIEKVTEVLNNPNGTTNRWRLESIVHDRYEVLGLVAGVTVTVNGDFDVLEQGSFVAITKSDVYLNVNGTFRSQPLNYKKDFPNIRHKIDANDE